MLSMAKAFDKLGKSLKATVNVCMEGNAKERREALKEFRSTVETEATQLKKQGAAKIKRIKRNGIHINVTFGKNKKK